ncbi:MFS transporter [Paraburkholderia sp. ZP32-5]|uniref:MFS transporter n=1 Tax=Paraburkholderia sp. ZP32-5 TaxID=2883245 RepID=UPI001F27F469|nr:MFS transporter [Paraburkholderia sp. ZP32-5]
MPQAPHAPNAPQAANASIETRTIAKISGRIVPFLVLAFFISFIDRVNVGFAALEMNRQLGFTATAFGWGVGAFFVSLCLFEVPANVLMAKVGARLWICRIMISWGLVSGATAFVTGEKSFLALRFLLGVAEAGFFPGVILYLGTWFPSQHRARVLSLFLMAMPLANFIGSPISGALLGLDGVLGLHGWQWLFLIEAVPAVVMGLLALVALPDDPSRARWLSDEGREWLTASLAEERRQPARVEATSIWQVLRHPRVLGLAVIYAGSVGCNYALSYWQPQMIKSFGLSNFDTGLINAIPFGIASAVMILWARRSDRRGERVWHTALPLMVSAAGLIACMFLNTLAPTVIALTVALAGCYSVKAPMFALCAESLSARTSAAGIGQVCAIGNIAGVLCPTLVGWIRDLTGNFRMGLLPMVVLALIGTLVTLTLRRERPADIAPGFADGAARQAR